MQQVGWGYTAKSLEQLEARISAEAARKRAELFGNKEVAVAQESELGGKIDTFVSNLVKQFPPSHNNSRFIHSTFTVSPELHIPFSDLQPILQEERKGSLFFTEVGKYIQVGPLTHPYFGDFTKESTRLELTNIHFPKNASLVPNDWTLQRARKESNLLALNHTNTIGEVDIDPNLHKIQLVADIRFGAFEAKGLEITAETRDGQTLELIISLSQLSLSGKIRYDGSVKLENATTFSIDQVIGTEPVTWIDVSHLVHLQFDL